MTASLVSRRTFAAVAAVAIACAWSAGPLLARKKSPPPEPPKPADVVARLLADELVSQGAYKKLQWLTDRIGHRLSGSPQARAAVEWALADLARDGLENVHPEKVMVPVWVRGEASANVVAPVAHRLFPLALGGSISTPSGGIRAEVVEAASIDELKALGSMAAGKIVLLNKQIVANGGRDDGYGAGARLRYLGPAEAARVGAVGMLLRSLGTANLRTPHTGSTAYADDVKPIPAAAIAAEDADLLHRLLSEGLRPEVELKLGCRTEPDAESANVVAELVGSEEPGSIVVIGAHLDSWDVGQGAIDDGAGVVAVMESMRLLKAAGLRPKRTIRAVLFMNEENGLRGGQTYAQTHKDELARHVAALESDFGAAKPHGLGLAAGPGGAALLARLIAPLRGIGSHRVLGEEHTGADIGPMAEAGVPLMGIGQDGTHYFDWHHTEADTLDKVDPDELVLNVVTMAYTAWALANSSEVLPRIPAEPPAER